jgi:uncharacterized membrane protein
MEGNILIILLVAVFMMALVLVQILYGFSFISVMELEEYESWSDAFGWGILITFTLLVISFFQMEILSGEPSVSANITGVMVPVGVSLYLLATKNVRLVQALLATTVVAIVSFPLVQVRDGSLAMEFPLWLLPAVVAASLAYFLAKGDGMKKAALAYFSGSMGVFLGGDLLRLWSTPSLAKGRILLGADGLLDFVFLMGVVAVAMLGIGYFLVDRFRKAQWIRSRTTGLR